MKLARFEGEYRFAEYGRAAVSEFVRWADNFKHLKSLEHLKREF